MIHSARVIQPLGRVMFRILVPLVVNNVHGLKPVVLPVFVSRGFYVVPNRVLRVGVRVHQSNAICPVSPHHALVVGRRVCLHMIFPFRNGFAM
jgi:hypothetical protein